MMKCTSEWLCISISLRCQHECPASATATAAAALHLSRTSADASTQATSTVACLQMNTAMLLLPSICIRMHRMHIIINVSYNSWVWVNGSAYSSSSFVQLQHTILVYILALCCLLYIEHISTHTHTHTWVYIWIQ